MRRLANCSPGAKRSARVFGLALVLLASSSCGEERRADVAQTGRTLEVEANDFFGLAWTDDTTLITGRSGPTLSNTVVTVGLDGQVTQVPLPGVAGCLTLSYDFPQRMSDGRISMGRSCTRVVGMDPARPDSWAPVTLNSAGSIELLGKMQSLVNPAGVSWSLRQRRGVVALSSSLCSSVGYVDAAGGVKPADELELELDGQRWSAGADFLPKEIDSLALSEDELDALPDCTQAGKADWPVFSPDEDRLALVGAPPGRGGFEREHAVFVAAGGSVRAVARGFEEPRCLAWSADGSALYVSGRRGGDGGVWRIDVADGRLTLLLNQEPTWFAVSPDGRRLAALQAPDGDLADPARMLVVHDLPG